MKRNLTTSLNDRRKILSDNDTVKVVYENLGFHGVMFEGRFRFTAQQVASFYEVDYRTIQRMLENNSAELEENGYEIFRGSRLRDLRAVFIEQATQKDVYDIDVVDIVQVTENDIFSAKAPTVGIFTFKSVLNVGMLLTTSEKARQVRSAILDIVIDALNKKLGGSTKYINQREEEFLPSMMREYNYRQEFTNALDKYIQQGNKFKYSQLTDKIYKSIFRENAKEYRKILDLNSKQSVRATMYSEVLDLIASYENGFSDYLKKAYEKNNNEPIRLSQAHELFREYEEMTEKVYEPLREKARSLMATRDMAFRDALHEKLREYIDTVSLDDIDKFLGEKSKALEERIEENKEIFKRLKDR